MKEYVAAFVQASDGDILLIEKLKPEWQKGLLNGVGGKIEPGETPLEAIRREFLEEVGTSILEPELRVVLSGNDWRVHFFIGDSDKSCVMQCEAEVPVWVDPRQLPENVIPNLRWLIPICWDTDIKGPVEIQDVSAPATGAANREHGTLTKAMTTQHDTITEAMEGDKR